jgi:hypothetical protein
MVRYSELFETASEKYVKQILEKNFDIRGTYSVNSDNDIDIDGSCVLEVKIKKIPIMFGKVSGHFICGGEGLKSLEGAPKYVGKRFSCGGNALVSLKGAPKYVGGDFVCSNNPLKDLSGIDNETILQGRFYCPWFEDLPLLRTLIAQKGMYSSNFAVNNIINQFIPHTNLRHAVLDCQKALIEAGYAGNARW